MAALKSRKMYFIAATAIMFKQDISHCDIDFKTRVNLNLPSKTLKKWRTYYDHVKEEYSKKL